MPRQLLVLGVLVCLATVLHESDAAKHRKQKPNNHLTLEYNWPDPNPNIDHFPHESSCHYYYLVLSEEDIELKRCPEGELFDYLLHKCVRKESARCWSRHFGKMKHRHVPSKHRDQLRCPYEWGKFPVLYDCTKYYACVNNKAKLKKCAPFEKFDKVQRKCVAEIDAVCADETDHVEPGYKCLRNWGSFPFPKDCSKYYECLQKTPSLRTCTTGELFDERQDKCLPKHHVKCGSRHNPYESSKKQIPSSEPPMSILATEVIVVNKEENKNNKETILSNIESSPLSANMPSGTKLIELNPTSAPDEKPTVEDSKLLTDNGVQKSSVIIQMEQSPISDSRSALGNTLSPSKYVVSNEQRLTNTLNGFSEKSISQSSLVVPKESKSTDASINTHGNSVSPDPVGLLKEQKSTGVSSSKSEKSISSPFPSITDQSTFTSKGALEISVPAGSSSFSVRKEKIFASDSTNEEIKTSPVPTASQHSDVVIKTSNSGEFIKETSIREVDKSSAQLPVHSSKTEEIVTEVSNIGQFVEKKATEFKKVSEIHLLSSAVEVVTEMNKNEMAEERKFAMQKKENSVPSSVNPDHSEREVTKNSENEIDHSSTGLREDSKETCRTEDSTCFKDKDGSIIRCPAKDGLFPYGPDERKFIMCEDNNIRVPECPKNLLFDPVNKKCIWKAVLF